MRLALCALTLAPTLARSHSPQAVAKYNRTEAPEVLQTARKALCLSEAAGAQVHAAVYDAQLDLLLDDTKSTLDEADMEILGELEGMLQVRSASAALRRRTEPLYQQTASAALAAIFDAPTDGNAISLWGKVRDPTRQSATSPRRVRSPCRHAATEVPPRA